MARRIKGDHTRLYRSMPASYDGIIRLWVLRLLVGFGGHRALIEERHLMDDDVMPFLGLSRFANCPAFSAEAARAALRAKLAGLEARLPELPAGTALANNLDWLGDTLQLAPVDRDLLHFAVTSTQHPILNRVLGMLGCLTFGAIHQLFALVLGRSAKEIRQAIRPSGALARTGLLHFDLRNRYCFENKVELLGGLADRLALRKQDPLELFRDNFVPAPGGALQAGDYPHLAKDLPILECYLRDALAGRRKGVNVLVHGIPGTGKTEFARLLARRLGCTLFAVATEDEDGDPLHGNTRFRSYRLAQSILASGSGNLILFDEVEDVFRRQSEDPMADRFNPGAMKGWVNKTLEENPVPSVWITNAAYAIDPAFIRRFDYVLEIGVPPRSVRAKVLDSYLSGLAVAPAWKAAMAEHESLVPAVVERAAKVIGHVRRSDPGIEAAAALALVMGNTLEAMGEPRGPRSALPPATVYRPELLSTDTDLATLKAGLLAEGSGRLCFYGPPGTGKTAFGRHLADVLDRPLLMKRASDLQSKWVGETEHNMARMFQEAAAENAVLLLDEADSFLQDRKDAQRSWEISQVNEMLTQIEGFAGVFIASTNLMDSLDAAALRRFDLKIHFDYLGSDQAWAMFQDTAGRLGIALDASARPALGRIRLLTPGDFANVARQSRLRRIATAADLVARLAAECEAKPEGRRKRIGFQGGPELSGHRPGIPAATPVPGQVARTGQPRP